MSESSLRRIQAWQWDPTNGQFRDAIRVCGFLSLNVSFLRVMSNTPNRERTVSRARSPTSQNSPRTSIGLQLPLMRPQTARKRSKSKRKSEIASVAYFDDVHTVGIVLGVCL